MVTQTAPHRTAIPLGNAPACEIQDRRRRERVELPELTAVAADPHPVRADCDVVNASPA